MLNLPGFLFVLNKTFILILVESRLFDIIHKHISTSTVKVVQGFLFCCVQIEISKAKIRSLWVAFVSKVGYAVLCCSDYSNKNTIIVFVFECFVECGCSTIFWIDFLLGNVKSFGSFL